MCGHELALPTWHCVICRVGYFDLNFHACDCFPRVLREIKTLSHFPEFHLLLLFGVFGLFFELGDHVAALGSIKFSM